LNSLLSLKIDDVFEKPLKMDENHPEFKERILYRYDDSNVLVEGVQQAQALLKTLVFEELPEKMEEKFSKLKVPADIERSMQQSVLVSHLLDAEQQKTAKIINPLRPMRPFPRNYGITEARKK
jgi:large subunit ribosomal protein L37